ncbi:MAG: hypothetical protein KDA81_01860 [Planctomycetaceae bacterium]|nr:hypothetical protein [Planctomycetaceae bacterium]
MSLTLDPVVADRLEQFRRRRRFLLCFKCLSAGILVLVPGMVLVAGLDWYWILGNEIRWGLSLSVYCLTAVSVWFCGLKQLLNEPAQEKLAATVELAEPALRENLLSAVELATDDDVPLSDSPVFRRLLQSKVAHQMKSVRIRRLLPFRLISRWLMAAGLFSIALCLMVTLGGTRFRHLATRALLPGANIARVSRINVEILEPTPHSLLLAENETVAVVASVSGGTVEDAFLETTTDSGGTTRHRMQLKADETFSANISVADESIEYRILAGDAITRYFQIDVRPRPRVVEFQKTFRFPDYAELPEQSLIETNGDLVGLEGTVVHLELKTDQPVSTAELRVQNAGAEETDSIELIPGLDGQWCADIRLDRAAVYKVNLVSKETGFGNPFSPRYEIRPEPDLVPRVGFVDQAETNLLLPPNDILELKAVAEDDVSLVNLVQEVSVNGREWVQIPLSCEELPEDSASEDSITGKSSAIQKLSSRWSWDLLPYGLKSGDQLLTRLVATDRKGNVGESISLSIVIAADDFDVNRHLVMEAKTSFYPLLLELSEGCQEDQVTAFEILERWKNDEPASVQWDVDSRALVDLVRRQESKLDDVFAELRKVQRAMPPGADSSDLELVGRELSQLRHDVTAQIPAAVRKLPFGEQKQKTVDLAELRKSFERLAGGTQSLAKDYQRLMTHNVLMSAALDMNALLRQQQRIVNHPTQTWDRLKRHETVVVNQLSQLEQLLRRHRSRLNESNRNQVLSWIQWLQQQRERLQHGMESEDKLPELVRASTEFLTGLEQRQNFAVADGGLPGHLIGIWRDLNKRSGSLYAVLDGCGRSFAELAQAEKKVVEAKDSEEGELQLNQVRRILSDLELHHRSNLEQMRRRRELQQFRVDANPQYAADLGLTSRAVDWQLELRGSAADLPGSDVAAGTSLGSVRTPPSNAGEKGDENPVLSAADARALPSIDEVFATIAPAFRTLEAGHELTQTLRCLKHLASLERWSGQEVVAGYDHPRQWDVINQSFESISHRLNDAKVSPEIRSHFDQARWSRFVHDIGRKVSERRWRRNDLVSADRELEALQQLLVTVREELEPAMLEARELIAQFAPDVVQLAETSALELRKLENQTTDAADQLERSQNSAAEEQVRDVAQQQQAIQEKMADLVDALIDDANTQDSLRESSRERARDADDSISMVRQASRQLDEAIREAGSANDDAATARELSQVAEIQEQAAQKMDMIAEHFRRLDAGEDVADSRELLRQAEQELGLARQMDQKEQAARELQSLADQSAADVLKQLEEELKSNAAMQQALSEISKHALENAQSALEYAAMDEQNMQRQNEASDETFQAKKRELVQDLRELSQDAAELSRQTVAQARNAASQGRTQDAQQKFESAQKKLTDAALNGGAAREEELLSDLSRRLSETQQSLQEAVAELAEAERFSGAAKDQELTSDEAARKRTRESLERSQKQFFEQQKKSAKDVVRRAEDGVRRAQQQVRNLENNLRNYEKQADSARRNLERKPDDAGLQRNLASAEARQSREQAKLDQQRQMLQESQGNVQQAKERQAAVERQPQTPLNSANPGSELAEHYGRQARESAESMVQEARELAEKVQWGNELSPTKSRLAQSFEQQGRVREDVEDLSEDIARAARHERRLNNEAAMAPLQAASDRIRETSDREVTTAEQRLQQAEQAAVDPDDPSSVNSPQGRREGQAAQAALNDSQQALAQRASDLAEAIEPLLQDGASDEGETSPNRGSPDSQTNLVDSTPTDRNSSGQVNQSSDSTTAAGNRSESSAMPSRISPEELARGRQLAQALDELDRQLSPGSTSPAGPDSTTQAASNTTLPQSLRQEAERQQAQSMAARTLAQQRFSRTLSEGSQPSDQAPPETGPDSDAFIVRDVARDGEDWGRLRSKSAENLTRGRNEAVSEEYRRGVEAYFRVLAERARADR